MNDTRIFLGIIVGSLSMGIMLSAAAYLFSAFGSTGSGNFISLPNPEIIGMVVGAIIGGVLGGIIGGFVIGLDLTLVKAVLFGLILTIILSVAILLWTGGGGSSNDLAYTLYALIIIGTITAAIVSFVNLGENPVE